MTKKLNIQPIWQSPLVSPKCPFCGQEMSLNEHEVDQGGGTTVVWGCDFCGAAIETNILPPRAFDYDWELYDSPIHPCTESPRRGD